MPGDRTDSVHEDRLAVPKRGNGGDTIMSLFTRLTWVNALLLVFMGLAMVTAGAGSASTKAEVSVETKVDMTRIGSIFDVPATPPSDDAGKDEAERIVEAYGGGAGVNGGGPRLKE